MRNEEDQWRLHDLCERAYSIPRQIISPLFRVYLLLLITLLTSHYMVPSQASAAPWSRQASEAEVYELISQLLSRSDLPHHKIKRGSYPLFLEGEGNQVLPLLSAPCPLLSDCETLIKSIRAALLQRGVHLVYSDQKTRKGGPLHFAVAQGTSPLMALRLSPNVTSATLLFHLSTTIPSLEALDQLSPHLTYALSEEVLINEPNIVEWLERKRREYILKLDHLRIKRALLDPSSGKLIEGAEERREVISTLLIEMVKRAPHSLGFYLDQSASYALDRITLEALVKFCAKQHRVLVVSQLHDTIPQSVARAYGVRVFPISASGTFNGLNQQLKSLETRLVLDGQIAAEFTLSTTDELHLFLEWLRRLTARQVSYVRLSEVVW
jgi:hypothetical protein